MGYLRGLNSDKSEKNEKCHQPIINTYIMLNPNARALIIKKYFDSKVPLPGDYDEVDLEILSKTNGVISL